MRCNEGLQTNVMPLKLLTSDRITVLLVLVKRFVEASKTRTSVRSVLSGMTKLKKEEEGNAGKSKEREYMDLRVK
jgi:hypothetical protein